jgi:hypothetical protein
MVWCDIASSRKDKEVDLEVTRTAIRVAGNASSVERETNRTLNSAAQIHTKQSRL